MLFLPHPGVMAMEYRFDQKITKLADTVQNELKCEYRWTLLD